ncbi:hypothetical protein P7C71_g6351, partial [Lecanoromycetidae sp. Uapishka_2]
MYFRGVSLATVLLGATSILAWNEDQVYQHVAVFSVDGLHSSDVGKYVALRPKSTIAQLLQTGYEYTNAFTSAPSDSFPGTVAPFTGASPRTSGVWYDDIYDRSFYPPFSKNETRCEGPPGAEVEQDETLDYNSTELFSGGINPDNLPQAVVNGKCTEIYPHARLRVNTVFEIVEASGKQTAYTDKHPAYDLVRGPSGKGLTVGYFPEIAAIANTVDATIAYDQLHVNAFLDWIAGDGSTPDNSEIQGAGLTTTPTVFGGNFQAVSVGQKTAGYTNGTLTFTAPLLKALDFVDDSLGQVVSALKAKNIYDDTLIIVASKHGQAPINPALYRKIDNALIAPATGVNVSFVTADDIALIFLEDQSTLETAVQGLVKATSTLQIQDIIYGTRLTALGFGDPKTDPAVPDIIVRPELGVIYTTSTAKIAEHGGLSDDDRHVACFVSGSGLKQTQFGQRVSTRQVAPTVLKVLGLNPGDLEGVKLQGTEVLDGF